MEVMGVMEARRCHSTGWRLIRVQGRSEGELSRGIEVWALSLYGLYRLGVVAQWVAVVAPLAGIDCVGAWPIEVFKGPETFVDAVLQDLAQLAVK
jgi:hypothetical protein